MTLPGFGHVLGLWQCSFHHVCASLDLAASCSLLVNSGACTSPGSAISTLEANTIHLQLGYFPSEAGHCLLRGQNSEQSCLSHSQTPKPSTQQISSLSGRLGPVSHRYFCITPHGGIRYKSEATDLSATSLVLWVVFPVWIWINTSSPTLSHLDSLVTKRHNSLFVVWALPTCPALSPMSPSQNKLQISETLYSPHFQAFTSASPPSAGKLLPCHYSQPW